MWSSCYVVTGNRFSGFALGALLTALIQSSSAVSSITVALVDSGVIGFFNSLAVLIGANLGSTFTAWLVAFKMKYLGSYLLVLGTLQYCSFSYQSCRKIHFLSGANSF
ncbi:MAG: Na/Pi symporter [Cytophagaceae bacterium]